MRRERLTITLASDLLTAIDSLIDKETLRNRSQTIEHLLKEGIGLHQLQQAFLFWEEDYFNQAQIEKVVNICLNSGIAHFFLCLPSQEFARQHELSAIIHQLASQLTSPTAPTLQLVPLDFGSGGALLLQKSQLEHSFLLAWMNPELVLPETFTAAYLFHRQHHAPLTQLLYTSSQEAYINSQVAIAEPEILSFISTGITSLPQNVFPELIKRAKVKGYIFTA